MSLHDLPTGPYEKILWRSCWKLPRGPCMKILRMPCFWGPCNEDLEDALPFLGCLYESCSRMFLGGSCIKVLQGPLQPSAVWRSCEILVEVQAWRSWSKPFCRSLWEDLEEILVKSFRCPSMILYRSLREDLVEILFELHPAYEVLALISCVEALLQCWLIGLDRTGCSCLKWRSCNILYIYIVYAHVLLPWSCDLLFHCSCTCFVFVLQDFHFVSYSIWHMAYS